MATVTVDRTGKVLIDELVIGECCTAPGCDGAMLLGPSTTDGPGFDVFDFEQGVVVKWPTARSVRRAKIVAVSLEEILPER